jgi:hypothetical protein
MKTLRRALLALGVTATVMAIVRLRGRGGTPPRQGGWRELSAEELSAEERSASELPGQGPAAGPPGSG